ncbi:DUF1653 domain-containing protein [Roseovarius sp. CAU 1744]|uniref:DUF1653 domain-containing protein n=1 Tax=Roseovarius sp. CAU 1744 TaxID=3140368 RepID=UPI00325B2D8E
MNVSAKPSRLSPVFELLARQSNAQRAVDRWVPTHRHRKGGFYRVVGHGTLESDRSPVVIYDDAEGQVWVRPTREFEDGRFEPVSP